MKLKNIVVLISAFGILNTFASSQDGAVVKEVEIRNNGTVIVIMNAPRTSEVWASCIDTQWHKTHWAFSPSSTTTYKELLAFVLTAKSTGSIVRVTGADNCNAFGSIESIEAFVIK
jgi:hypothetical protein